MKNRDRHRPAFLPPDEGPSLFDVVVERRDVRLTPPSQVGSESSERGARAAASKANTQMEGILAILATLPQDACLSRDAIVTRFNGKLSVPAACGRLGTLVDTLHHVERVEQGAVSNAGVTVLGYRLSPLGWARIGERRAAS